MPILPLRTNAGRPIRRQRLAHMENLVTAADLARQAGTPFDPATVPLADYDRDFASKENPFHSFFMQGYEFGKKQIKTNKTLEYLYQCTDAYVKRGGKRVQDLQQNDNAIFAHMEALVRRTSDFQANFQELNRAFTLEGQAFRKGLKDGLRGLELRPLGKPGKIAPSAESPLSRMGHVHLTGHGTPMTTQRAASVPEAALAAVRKQQQQQMMDFANIGGEEEVYPDAGKETRTSKMAPSFVSGDAASGLHKVLFPVFMRVQKENTFRQASKLVAAVVDSDQLSTDQKNILPHTYFSQKDAEDGISVLDVLAADAIKKTAEEKEATDPKLRADGSSPLSTELEAFVQTKGSVAKQRAWLTDTKASAIVEELKPWLEKQGRALAATPMVKDVNTWVRAKLALFDEKRQKDARTAKKEKGQKDAEFFAQKTAQAPPDPTKEPKTRGRKKKTAEAAVQTPPAEPAEDGTVVTEEDDPDTLFANPKRIDYLSFRLPDGGVMRYQSVPRPGGFLLRFEGKETSRAQTTVGYITAGGALVGRVPNLMFEDAIPHAIELHKKAVIQRLLSRRGK